MSVNCPYCKKPLEKIPTRKKKCPKCGENIFVRKGQLLTKKESVFIDAKTNLLGMGLKGVGNAKNTDDLWRVLNENIILLSKKGDLQNLSSIYLQMGIICFDEGRYRECIQNYLLCGHYSSVKSIRDSKEYGMRLMFSDLLNVDNYMITRPVISSIEELKIDGIDTNNLGILSVTPDLSLTQKLRILRDVFDGKIDELNTLSDNDKELVKEKHFSESFKTNIKTSKNKNSGCFGVFALFISFIFLFIW